MSEGFLHCLTVRVTFTCNSVLLKKGAKGAIIPAENSSRIDQSIPRGWHTPPGGGGFPKQPKPPMPGRETEQCVAGKSEYTAVGLNNSISPHGKTLQFVHSAILSSTDVYTRHEHDMTQMQQDVTSPQKKGARRAMDTLMKNYFLITHVFIICSTFLALYTVEFGWQQEQFVHSVCIQQLSITELHFLVQSVYLACIWEFPSSVW